MTTLLDQVRENDTARAERAIDGLQSIADSDFDLLELEVDDELAILERGMNTFAKLKTEALVTLNMTADAVSAHHTVSSKSRNPSSRLTADQLDEFLKTGLEISVESCRLDKDCAKLQCVDVSSDAPVRLCSVIRPERLPPAPTTKNLAGQADKPGVKTGPKNVGGYLIPG